MRKLTLLFAGLLVIGLVILISATEYSGDDIGSTGGDGTTGTGDDTQQQTGGETGDEKPPRPPE